MAQNAQKKPYRRRILLIDRKFQLRFCLYVCSWLFMLSLAYPLIIQSLFNFFLRYMTQDPYGPALTAIQQTREQVLSALIILQGLFLGVTFLLSIFVSHRIAGPLYKLRAYFASGAQGLLKTDLKFRKGDYFQNLADEYNQMALGIVAARAREAAQISSLLEKGDTEQALTLLRRIASVK